MALRVGKRGLVDERQTYDTETGEVEDGALVWIPRRDRSAFGDRWFEMAQKTLQTVNAHRKELGLEGLVVFNALMSRLDWENYIQVSQSEIATELDMRPSNVSRAMRKLLHLGFVRQGPKVGRSHTYQLHPDLVWKGKPKKHFAAQQKAASDGWTVIEGGKASDLDPNQMTLPFEDDPS